MIIRRLHQGEIGWTSVIPIATRGILFYMEKPWWTQCHPACLVLMVRWNELSAGEGGGDGCHKNEGAERHFPAHLSDSVICADTFIAVSHPWTSGNYCGKSWYSVWPCQRKFITRGVRGGILKNCQEPWRILGCMFFFKGRCRMSEWKRRSVQNCRSFSVENTSLPTTRLSETTLWIRLWLNECLVFLVLDQP